MKFRFAPKGKLVPTILHGREGFVNRELRHPRFERRMTPDPLSFRRASEARQEESAVRREAPLTVSPVPNTEAKPRRADGTARAKCVGPLGKLRKNSGRCRHK